MPDRRGADRRRGAFAYGAEPTSLDSVGAISAALTPALGAAAGKVVFGAGVLGASMVAAIVASLALAWGVGEIAGYKRTLETHPFAAGWFAAVYTLCVLGAAFAVWACADLVWLNIAAQVLNAFLMPLVVGFLVALAATALPEPHRLRGSRLAITVGVCAVVSALGIWRVGSRLPRRLSRAVPGARARVAGRRRV